MTQEHQSQYWKLISNVFEQRDRLFKDGKQLSDIDPAPYNSALAEMQTFLTNLPEDYSNNMYMHLKPLEPTNVPV